MNYKVTRWPTHKESLVNKHNIYTQINMNYKVTRWTRHKESVVTNTIFIHK